MTPTTAGLALLVIVAAWLLSLDHYLTTYAKPYASVSHDKVDHDKRIQVPVQKSNGEGLFIVAGGCGFTGSWIVRYLIMRGERNVVVWDRKQKLPNDIRGSTTLDSIDLTSRDHVSQALKRVHQKVTQASKVVVFNCAARIEQHRSSYFGDNIAIATNLRDVLTDSKIKDKTVMVHIGDSISTTKPVNWLNYWNRSNWVQNSSPDLDDHNLHSRHVNTYAYTMHAAESILLNSDIVCASLRPHGFISGHLGDSFLTPALHHDGGLMHSPNVPVFLINVEDVAIGALCLEDKLANKDACPSVNHRAFSLAPLDHISFEGMYNRIRALRDFRVIRIQPVVVLVISYIIGLYRLFIREVYLSTREQCLLSGIAQTLTPQRFSVLQTVKLPLNENTKRTSQLIGYNCQWTAAQTVDAVVLEHEKLREEMKQKETAES
uniref:ARAD1D23584p n=1 Tax=Blastobotrys adeninivorans TaxID=409370 RepID=A0A060TGH0_BLAAD